MRCLWEQWHPNITAIVGSYSLSNSQRLHMQVCDIYYTIEYHFELCKRLYIKNGGSNKYSNLMHEAEALYTDGYTA